MGRSDGEVNVIFAEDISYEDYIIGGNSSCGRTTTRVATVLGRGLLRGWQKFLGGQLREWQQFLGRLLQEWQQLEDYYIGSNSSWEDYYIGGNSS